MRRVSGAITAVALAALAVPAGAAEISHVASSGDEGNPFDIEFSLRWDRSQERAEISREVNAAGRVVEGDEMRFVRTRNAMVPRVAVGLYKDVEIHFALPYVLGDDRSLRYGLVGGVPAGGVPPFDRSTIETNGIDPQGRACTDQNPDIAGAQCPLFRVPQTVYHGGRAGDLEAGLAWAIFNDRKDDTKPTWVVGLDATFPTAAKYEPAKDRGVSDWASPHAVPAKPGPFGERAWKWDLYTVLSRRMGPIDPYFKAHATKMFRSSSTYSNCDFAAEMANRTLNGSPFPQATSIAEENCRTWGTDARAQLPWVTGITFGTEVTPYEDRAADQKVSLDFRLFGDYTSAHRFYNELSDYSGKIHETEGYLTMGGLLGVYLRTSKYVSLNMSASLATRTAHRLTGESLGRDGDWPALDSSGNGITADPTLMNPNFDWRYDAPGRRFRISEVSVFELSFAGVLQF